MARLICGKSVIGSTHKKNGKPCQDCFKFFPKDKDSNVTIIAVADGHGSDKSPRSQKGSELAVNAFYDVMTHYLEHYKDNITELVTFLNRYGQTKFAQDVCEEWQKKVKRSFAQTKDKEDIEIPLDEQGKTKWDEVYRLYGSTLLGLLIMKTYVFAFQIGDGDIVLVDKDSISPVVETEKILGTETHSLSKTDAWKNSVSVMRRRDVDADKPYLYMLSTDGFINSYASDEEYKKTCRDYYDMIGEHGFDKVSDNLERWLAETSELGCGDDITLVLAYIN